jgi:hypothetical protein
MNEFLLVLILLADPSARPAADSIAQRITDQAGSQVHVLIGAEALAELKKHDVTAADLANQPAIGMALTSHDHKLAVVRIDREERGGNIVIESAVWALGHRETHVAIAGANRRHAPPSKPEVDGQPPLTSAGIPPAEANDPLDSVQRGVIAILTPWLGTAGGTPAAEVENRLAGLADHDDWKQIISLTETLPTPSPRQRYYRILALVHSNRHVEAETAYQSFRAAQPTHVLLSALDNLLHPPQKPVGPAGPDINNDPATDDGANVLH